MIALFIDEQRGAGRGVESICQVLREQGFAVAPRTYRAWKRRAPAARTHRDAEITDALRRVKAGGPDGRALPEVLYGRRKMTAWLSRNGFPEVSKHTVDRLMRDEGMHGMVRGRATRTHDRRLRRFVVPWPQARWAIEGAVGLGAPLTERLRADGIAVIDVPAKLAPRVRLLSTGHGRKSDPADALSVGIAAWSAPALRTVEIDQAVAALRALTEHRDDLVRTRTQVINRLHALLVKLIPSGMERGLTADAAAEALKRVRPRDLLGRTLRQLAADLIAELRRLDRRVAELARVLSAAVAESGTTLTKLVGVGDVVAATILARTGSISRFPTPATFALFCGVAPIEVSSGDVVRHRLSRAGDRRLNYMLHVIAITQIRYESPGRGYYQRKRAAGKSHKEALRCLKRRLADVVYRTMTKDSVSSLSAAA